MLRFGYIFLVAVILLMPKWAASNERIKIGLTPVFVEHQSAFIKKFQRYLGESMGQEVEFVQRASYQGVTQLLLEGKIDAAWICGYPYVRHQYQLDLIAAPVFEGAPLYQAYIIVPATDEVSTSIEDLEGRVFAYSDPDSNSGYLFPKFLIWQTGKPEQSFFKKSFFTSSHNNVVDAVASGLADGGAVDGYVWESLKKTNPELVNKTRVIIQSETFGHPPIVVRDTLNPQLKEIIRKAFVNMQTRADGQELLEQLNLDGFMPVEPQLYDAIESMMFILGEPTHLFSNEEP